jgi:hypothetical protein
VKRNGLSMHQQWYFLLESATDESSYDDNGADNSTAEEAIANSSRFGILLPTDRPLQ